MATGPNVIYDQSQLQPARNPEDARLYNVNLKASTSYARGQVLGQVTNTGAAAVQTIALTGVPTGGSVTLSSGLGYPVTSGGPTTLVLPYNATAAVAQPLFDAVYGPGNTVVSGGALPGTALVVTFTGSMSSQPIAAITMTANNLTGGTTPSSTITQTTTGAVNVATFGPYAHANADGTQVAKAILMYACTTDSLGNISIGPDGGGSDVPGYTQNHAPAYYAGTFRIEDLAGLPTAANLAADFPGARIAIGDLTSMSGLLVLPV